MVQSHGIDAGGKGNTMRRSLAKTAPRETKRAYANADLNGSRPLIQIHETSTTDSEVN
jgi:hypothetical protein